MSAKESFELDIGKQDDLRYWWRLSRSSGRVIDHGAELCIASCLCSSRD